MSNVDIVCPCCQGGGNDLYYNLQKCLVCDGNGHVHTELWGTIAEFEYAGKQIPASEFYDDTQMSIDIFQWLKALYNQERSLDANHNWWDVHSRVPMLATIEEILLDSGDLELSDIPGGPHNPNNPVMMKLADEKAKQQREQQMSGYNAYKDSMKKNGTTTAQKRAMIEKAAVKAVEARNRQKAAAEAAQTTPTTEEQKMSNSTPIQDRLKSGGSVIKDSMKRGVLMGTVTAANKTAVQAIEDRLGDKYPAALKTEAGRKVVQLAIPALLLMACEIDEANKIPMKDNVRTAATMAVEGVSAEAMEQAITFLLSEALPVLSAYAMAGAEINASHQIAEEFDAEAEMQRVAQRESTKVPSFAQ